LLSQFAGEKNVFLNLHINARMGEVNGFANLGTIKKERTSDAFEELVVDQSPQNVSPCPHSEGQIQPYLRFGQVFWYITPFGIIFEG